MHGGSRPATCRGATQHTEEGAGAGRRHQSQVYSSIVCGPLNHVAHAMNATHGPVRQRIGARRSRHLDRRGPHTGDSRCREEASPSAGWP